MTRQSLLATAIYLAVVPLVQAVEAFDGNIVLGRPTNTSISVNVLSLSDQEVYVEYGSRPGAYDVTMPTANLRANDPHVFELTGLEPDAGYSYRLRFRTQGNGEFIDSAPADFRTQRARGSAFTFAVQADSHMGAMTRHQKWCPTCGRELADDVTFANTMINIVKYNPDFLVDLGDTFMTSQNFGNGLFEIQNRQRGAPIREMDVIGDFLLLRGYLGQSAYTVPLFLVLGNHDTERQSRLDGTPDNIAVWANNSRKHYFPVPTANDFYGGSVEEVPHIGRHDGWYAWEWGDALFVGLDPFWNSRGGGPWGRTLGREQYDWLKETLESSNATFKFVFLHHLVGGLDNPFGGSRGGHIYAEYFEWGGRTPFDIENWSGPARALRAVGTAHKLHRIGNNEYLMMKRRLDIWSVIERSIHISSPWLEPSRAIRNALHKLVDIEGVEEFYNLSVDPYEHNNLLAADLSLEDKRHYEELKSGLTALLASD